MNEKKDLLLGLMLGIRNDFEVPPVLMNFLLQDDQGMEGLEFMLKDPKLSQRIPTGVRFNYEILYHKIKTSLTEEISSIRLALDDIEKAPDQMIHSVIQALYEKSIEDSDYDDYDDEEDDYY